MTTHAIEWRKHPCYKTDPLSGIEPALLNSEDITRYVKEGCLLEEEDFRLDRLKPASYEMRLLGTLYDWELKHERLERRSREIVDGEDVQLNRNSITYLWIQERLRLPEYIAARFNLSISAVHKGILLGTGPLIDPGFGGRLLIPLHNLTNNDYTLRGGKGIIWIEFTKVSKNRYWLPDREEIDRPPELREFRRGPIDDPDVYLNSACALGGVQSAYKGVLDRTLEAAGAARKDADAARQDANVARNDAEEFEKRVKTFGMAGGLGVVVGIATLILSAFVLVFFRQRHSRSSGRQGT